MWSTVASWIALLAFAAAAVNYYNPDLFRSLTSQDVPSTIEETIRPATKKKSKRTLVSKLDVDEKDATSSGDRVPNKKRKISIPSKDSIKTTTNEGQKVSLPRDEDGGMSNRDFAQQLSKTQSGLKLENNSKPTASKKERRAIKALQNGHESPNFSTENSSMGGRDADDDLSPIGSPSSGPVSTAPTSRAGDVSDMLEPPSAKPTTLRLTDIKEDKPKSSNKTFETVMTKKQRQRRSKQEENKALREEADRVQEAKKQAQLRNARMAEGTSNQTKANAFGQNPWKKTDPVNSPPVNAPLLDTFEDSPKPNGAVSVQPMSSITNGATKNVNAVRNEIGDGKTSALAASSRENLTRPALNSKSSWADEVDEEEQNKWANQLVEEEKWESVNSKKGKKKTRDTDTGSDASSSAKPAQQPISKANGVRPTQTVNRFQSMENIGAGADWEV